MEETIARAFLADLAAGRWADAEARETAVMREKIPAKTLEAVWKEIEGGAGTFQAIDGATVVPRDAFRVVAASCRFARGRRQMRITVDADGKVAGLFRGLVEADVDSDARAVIDDLSKGDVDAVLRRLEDGTARALTGDELRAAWAKLSSEHGALQRIESLRIDKDRAITIAVATCAFARGTVTTKVAYDLDQRIVGLNFLPAEAAAPWSAPPYVRPEAFDERTVAVGKAPALPGKLTMPRGSGPFPAVVLVHGSGPNDADETLEGNKPFKDLAWGLSSRGIAVLRYDKRTRVSPSGVTTVEQEVIEGARAAVELLAATSGVDRKRIVIVGHSQGGYLAPRIAKEVAGVAAIASLAGPTRPLPEVLLDQLDYIASLGGPGAEAVRKRIPDARAFKTRTEDRALMPGDDVVMPPAIHIPGAYFLDLRGYAPAKVAASLGKPVFIAQGGRDYQVTAPDLAGWKAHLPKSAIHEYPTLDHLFRAGADKSTPESYDVPAHVDEALIRDLGSFVRALR